jgi:hypothetical protein
MIEKLQDWFSKGRLSLILLVFLSFQFVKVLHHNKQWEDSRTIQVDASWYYVYLPATFIYQDLKYEYADSLNSVLGHHFATYYLNEEGIKVQKFSIGTAIMEMPFFLIAHTIAINDHINEPNGYSKIYHYFISLSTVFYAILALIMMRLILKKFFDDTTVAIILLLFGLGSNFFYYASFEGGLSHLPGLFLIGAFMLTTINWVETKKFSYLNLSILSITMAVIVRPSNVVFSLFWLFYIYESGWGYKSFLSYLKQLRLKLIIPILIWVLPILLQMSIWKYSTGHWVHYSYGDEGFFFSNPKILQGLFSARNGMFLYGSFLLLAFAGMFIRSKKIPRLSMIIPFVCFIYFIYSWWCWWYGGSYGSRAAIESYMILAIFLGVFLEYIMKKLNKSVVQIGLSILVLFSLYSTSIHTDMRYVAVIHWDAMTYQSYQDVFLSKGIPGNYSDHLENPDYAGAVKNGNEYDGFKELNSVNPESEHISIKLNNNDTIFVEMGIWGESKFYSNPAVLYFSLKNGEELSQQKIELPNLGREWNIAVFPVLIEDNMKGKDVQMFYSYTGDHRVFYKDWKIVESTNKP